MIRMILGEAATTILAGLCVGAGLAYAGVSLIRSQLFGVDANDPVMLGGAVALLVAIALAAA